ncbi:MAG: DNA translocase FtsK, partial [Candidatus Poribacteria bacterium]|nr:DNA translocase FtsK [Candidatus Poribacteria bacterium]
MTTDELIGQVGVEYLRIKLDEADDSDDTARYLIDRLSEGQTAAIAKAILADAALSEKVEIKLPAYLMRDQVLPSSILSEERATYYRNAECSKAALLLATTGDDEAQSLNHLTPIGIAQLMDNPQLWVDVASTDAGLLESHQKWWGKALKGLFELNICSLQQVAQYILQTCNAIADDGHPIVHALDAALPELQIPRGTGDFKGIKDDYRGHTAQWRRRYESAYRKYACYLRKYTPSQTLLNEEDLQAAFDTAKDAIPENYHSLIRAFIRAPSGWNDHAQELAECEWDIVGQPLFEGLKPEKTGIGELTVAFYDEREPEHLTESERDYLQRLKQRGRLPKNDEEDKQFYEDHRNELKEDRKLKSLWDRFIFKTPLESDDFLVGLIQCIERLLGAISTSGESRITIRCGRRSRRDLRDLNTEAGLYFSTRYRGLPTLFGPKVTWAPEFNQLFSFSELVETWRGESGSRLCESTAKAARQIKFTIELSASDDTANHATQLIWEFDLGCITTQFHGDFKRLVEHPLVSCHTSRESISTKGEFQPLDLSNVKSFSPAYGNERGSFVSVYKEDNDIAETWLRNLEEAKQEHLRTDDDIQQIRSRFEVFRTSYSAAIAGFMKRGVACHDLLDQLFSYAELLEALCRYAKGDRNR